MNNQTLLEQAARAERLARSILDTYAVEALTHYARQCREKADETLPRRSHSTPLEKGHASPKRPGE